MTQNIRKLTDYQHIRLRTEMYLGSRSTHTQSIITVDENGNITHKEFSWVPALYTSFREALDNSLDEIAHGYGNRIDITYDDINFIFSVEDNGRGIPTDWDGNENMHKATMVVSHLRAGRNFDERKAVAGTNGIGISAVNTVSEYFNLTIHHKNEKFSQQFREGNVVVDELQIDKPIIRKISSTKTGTKVEWKISSEVFKTLLLPEEFIYGRVREIALLNPNIKFYFNGNLIKSHKSVEKTLFKEFKPVILDINDDETEFKSTFYIIPNFSNNEMVHSVVNNIPAFNGGNHIDTFKTEFFRGMLSALEREGKKRKLTPNRSDINDGLLIYNVTTMNAPNFDSQSKTRLINEETTKIIKEYFKDEKIIKNIIKKHSDWIELIFERTLQRTNKKELADTKKLQNAAKRSKVEKLSDATGIDRSKCICFFLEGDSARAGLVNARDPKIHGTLPLRGKVLNVHGLSPKDVLLNKELVSIMNTLGLVIGEKANRTKMRYGKIYIATDMDPDGNQIAALLLNFFYTYWPELFDPNQDPVIYIFMTPFIIANKGKVRKYWYGHNYEEFKPEDYKGWEITRAKGLATLSKEDWKYSLDNPDLLPIVDDGNLAESMSLIFDSERANDRKEWIGM